MMGRRHVLRGTLKDGAYYTHPKRLILNNGDFKRNYRVVEFTIFPNMNRKSGNIGSYTQITTAPTNIANVALALEESGITEGEFRFNDSRQIAWFQGAGTSTPNQYRTYLDPNHIIVQDLWIGGYAVDTSDGSTEVLTVALNYHIVLEEITSSLNEAVLQLIKEKSQSV
jgi:hypothetical protein